MAATADNAENRADVLTRYLNPPTLKLIRDEGIMFNRSFECFGRRHRTGHEAAIDLLATLAAACTLDRSRVCRKKAAAALATIKGIEAPALNDIEAGIIEEWNAARQIVPQPIELVASGRPETALEAWERAVADQVRFGLSRMDAVSAANRLNPGLREKMLVEVNAAGMPAAVVHEREHADEKPSGFTIIDGYHPATAEVPQQYCTGKTPIGPICGCESDLAYAVEAGRSQVRNTQLRKKAKSGVVFVRQTAPREFELFCRSLPELHKFEARLKERRERKGQ